MNPKVEQLENILREFLKGIQVVLESGEVLSDEFQGLIAEQLSFLVDKISQLKEEGQSAPPTEPGEGVQEPEIEDEQIPPSTPGPQVPQAPHESSNIYGFRYDPESQNLVVKFQDKYPATNGPVYQYQNVPPYIFDIFRRGAIAPKTSGQNAWHRWERDRVPSHGAAMNALLKGGQFPYQKIS